MNDVIISVDVETSGPTPGAHQLLSIGAVAYDSTGIEYDTFSINIYPVRGLYDDPDTTAWWDTQAPAREALQENRKHLPEAIEEFDRFVRQLRLTGHPPVFLADPVIFDYPWINWAFNVTGFENPFHFGSPHGLKVIDLTSFAMGGLGMENTKRHEILNELDVGLSPHTHIAVEDARHQGELFFKIAKKIGWPK